MAEINLGGETLKNPFDKKTFNLTGSGESPTIGGDSLSNPFNKSQLKITDPNLNIGSEAPKVEPPKVDAPPVEPVISTKELTEPTAPVTPTFNRGTLVDNIQSTLDVSPNVVSNEPFVRGALKLAGIEETADNIAKYAGQKVGDIVNDLGIGGEFKNFGIQEPEQTASDKARSEFFSRAEEAKNMGEEEKVDSATDMLNSLSDEADAIASGDFNKLSDEGLAAQVKIGELTEQLNNLTQTYDANKALESVDAQDLKDQFEQLKDDTNIGATGRSIILGESAQAINDKLFGMNSQQVRDLATYTLNSIPLSNAILRAQGDYNAAVAQQKATSESMKWAFTQKLTIAQEQNKLTKDQATIAQQEFDNEITLANNGYVEVPEERLEQDRADIAAGLKDGVIITNPINGKSYWRDAAAEELSELDIHAGKAAIDAMYASGKITDDKLVKIGDKDYVQLTNADGSLTFIEPETPLTEAGTDKLFSQIGFIDLALTNTLGLAGAAGKTGAWDRLGRWIGGADEHTELIAEANSVRTNVLTLLGDPNIKKFFGPQMTEADVELMTAAATTLNPEKQRPEKVKAEITRLQSFMKKFKSAVEATSNFSAERYAIENPDKRDAIRRMIEDDMTDEEIGQVYGFSRVGSDTNKASKYVSRIGTITGFGSPLWEHGLDVDLKIGDPVSSPISGKVVKAGENGGFGKQVQIEDSSGNTIWLSHLKNFNVRAGQTVMSGQLVGKGGNTGQTIPGKGGDGSHLDITIKKPDGSYMTPHQVNNYLA